MQLERIRNALRDPIVIRRYLVQRRKLLRLRFRQRHNKGIFSVNLGRRSGFFATLSGCTWIYSYCDDRHLIPHVTSTNSFYVDPARGPDFLGYFFENPDQHRIDASVVARASIQKIQELGLPTRCFSQMTLERAAMLVRKYMHVRREIVDEVDRFASAQFEREPVLGVHFRGTDKHKEAPPVSSEQCVRVIRRFLNDHPEVHRIFVASDMAPFISTMREEFRSSRLSFCDDQRSDGKVAVHHPEFGGDNYKKGREALVNCLLLARCSTLIRCSSTMSGWASIFNPHLPVILLNQPYTEALWFPDRLVIQRATMANA